MHILIHHYKIFVAHDSLINQMKTGLDRMSLDLMFVCRHIKKVYGWYQISFLDIYGPSRIECQENKIIPIFSRTPNEIGCIYEAVTLNLVKCIM